MKKRAERISSCQHYQKPSSKTFRHSTYTIDLTWHDQFGNSTTHGSASMITDMKLCGLCGGVIEDLLSLVKKK